MEMSLEKRYQANPVVSRADEPDGAVLYNPDTDLASVVNLTGRQLWLFLETPRTVAEMVDFFFEQFSGVTAGRAAEDVERFIAALAPDFLLEVEPGDDL